MLFRSGITGGTGVTVTGSGSAGATPSVAIGQSVGTGDTVAFGGLNVDSGTLYVDSANNRVGINDTTPSFSLDVTGDGQFTTNLTVGSTVTAADFAGNFSGAIQFDVKNTSGSTITKGTPVYITGTVGATQVAEVSPSRADTSSTMPAVGILRETLTNNSTGHAAVIGMVGNLDTSTYTLNAPLYVGSTGGLTTTRPTTSTDIVQVVGFAGRINVNTGQVVATIYDQTRAPNSISIPGNIATTAGQFTGSGAGLTSIPAGQLTGTVGASNIGNDTVALGTKTTGDYVATVAASTGVTVSGGTGEGSTATISIGQAVATTSSPQFVGVTATGTVSANAVSVTNGVGAASATITGTTATSVLTVDGIEIDTTGATSNQVLSYNGTKFVPTTPASTTATPTGAVISYAGSSAPTGWLLCDGSAVSRSTYSALFTAISTRYGVGDGSTTFNLPSMGSKIASGITSGTPTNNVSATSNASGSHTHNTTTGTESANHTHNGTSGNQSANHDHNSNWTVTTGNDITNHTHTYDKSNGSNASATSGGVSAGHAHTWNANLSTGGNNQSHTHNTTTGNPSVSHTHNGTSGTESLSHTHSVSIVEFIYIIKT